MQNWEKVYTTQDRLRAEIVRSVLEESGYPAVILDKRDSSYNDFGEREVYVNKEDVVAALKIIEDEIEFE